MYFMILFFENGRLGNQLFQYHGFKNYFPKQQLFFFGCKRLKNSFDNLDVSFIDEKTTLYILLFIIPVCSHPWTPQCKTAARSFSHSERPLAGFIYPGRQLCNERLTR